MSSHEPPKAIEGRARTVRELLDKAKYAIDFYQREYGWEERHVRELVDDLTGRFLDHHQPGLDSLLNRTVLFVANRGL